MEKARWTEFNETTSSVHKSHIAHAHTHKPLQWLCMWSHARFIASRTQWPTKVCVILHISSGTYMPFRSFFDNSSLFCCFYFIFLPFPCRVIAARRAGRHSAEQIMRHTNAFAVMHLVFTGLQFQRENTRKLHQASPRRRHCRRSLCQFVARLPLCASAWQWLSAWESAATVTHIDATFLHTIYQLFRAFLATMNSEMLQAPLNCRTCTYVCA